MSILGRRFEWFPTLGGPSIMFGFTPPFLLLDHSGTAPVPAKPQVTQGPLQPGVTFLSSKIEGRTIELEVAVWADTWQLHEAAVEDLETAMAVIPEGGLGTLRLVREGMPDLEVECVPTDSPREKSGSASTACILSTYTIEFFAPMPYWQVSTQQQIALGASGGVEYPLSYPLEYTEVSSVQVIDYQGDVPAWPFIRIFGEGSNPIVKRTDAAGNVEQLAFTNNVSLASTDELQVVTQFGKKTVTLVQPGGTTNAFDALDINNTRFWQLEKGANTIEVEWESLTGGHITVTWQELRAGI